MKYLNYFSKNVFAHEFLHFFSGIVLAVIFYLWFSNIWLSLVCFLVSVFIDADHYTEGFFVEKFNLSKIFNNWPGNYWQKTGKVTLLLHSWEILPIILFLGKLTGQLPLALAICVSATVHYLIDTFLYSFFAGMSIFQYFLIYRIYHRFNFSVLCKNCSKSIK